MARYEHGSILLTSNTSFSNWGSLLGDEVLATALLDRLLHHAEGVAGLTQIDVGLNLDGRLEAFAVDTLGRAWHTVQPTPTSAFGPWSQLGDAVGLDQIVVGSNADGRLEAFALLQEIPTVFIVGPVNLEVLEAALQDSPTVDHEYDVQVISNLIDTSSLSITWTGDVQFSDSNQRNPIVTFDMTGHTRAGSSRTFQLMVATSNSLGVLANDKKTVTVHVVKPPKPLP